MRKRLGDTDADRLCEMVTAVAEVLMGVEIARGERS
jgi:hypothetical protein